MTVGACAALSGSRVPGGGGGINGDGHSLPGLRHAAGGAVAAGSPSAGRKTAGSERERHFENQLWEQSVMCWANLQPGRRGTEIT